MAKQRVINTRFWSDSWIVELDPLERYLFLYLLTNERTNICGIYELPLRFMAVETGLEKEMLQKILGRFERDKKVFYIENWVCLLNFAKHQSTKGDVQLGIERCLNEVPEEITSKLLIKKEALGGQRRPMDSSDTKLNLTKLNLIDNATKVALFNLLEELNKMKSDKRKHIQLIGEYLEEKKVKIDSKDELQVAIRRHLRSAMQLSKFSDDKIGRATEKAEKEYPEYTLETLVKILTR